METAGMAESKAWGPVPVRQPMARAEVPALRPSRVALFFALHAPLAVAVYMVTPLGVAHALGAFALGARWALSRQQPVWVACAAGYITGAEVLWRMAEAPVPWEFGKYAVASLLLLWLVRFRRLAGGMPMLYLALLLPSVALTATDAGPVTALVAIRTTLSGPFTLACAALFFTQVRLSRPELHRILLTTVAPALGVACTTLFLTVTAEELSFTDESNFQTSGGFGPNQVSAALSCGAVLALAAALDRGLHRSVRLMAFAAMALCITQSAMTFSRGGLYNLVGALVLSSPLLLLDRGSCKRLLGLAAATVLLAALIVLPRLSALTGGALERRFQDTGVTRRDDIAKAQWQLFRENPLFGVGLGRTAAYVGNASHTEPIRLVAEHGLLGVIALLVLAAMALQSIWRQRTALDKGLVILLLAWSGLFTLNVAMRLAAASFVFGLGCTRLPPPRRKRPRPPVPPPAAPADPMAPADPPTPPGSDPPQ